MHSKRTERGEGGGYIAIVDYDDFVCGVSGGDDGDTHVSFS